MKRIMPYLAIMMIILMCVFSEKCINSVKIAVDTCLYTLLPSLFPFFVFSKIFIMTNGGEKIGALFKFITKPLFNMRKECASVFFLGILCGYPVGAKSAVELYNQKVISKDEAQNLVGFCNNSGPLFLIGSVGIGMFSSKEFGVMLYLVHIISAITVGFILRKNIKPDLSNTKAKKDIKTHDGNVFIKAVEDSVITILNVFGYVILFAVIISFIDNAIIAGIFEMTTAIFKISKMDITIYQKFVLASVFASWAGASVHMQTLGIISKSNLSAKKYIFSKFLHACISFIYAFILMKFFPFSQTASSMNFAVYKTPGIINFFALISIIISGIYLFKVNIMLSNKK